MTMNVMLDTNILHSEGLMSVSMQRLLRLVKSGDLKIIIPEIVADEFKSKKKDESTADLNQFDASISNLVRKGVVPRNDHTLSKSRDYIAKLISEIDSNFDKWIVDNEIEIYQISNTSIEAVFNNYFNGVGAFGSKKKREDIPDAVIYDGILRLSEREPLEFVAKDGTLNKAVSDLPNVRCYSTLNELLQLGSLQEKLNELDTNDRQVTLILSTLNSSDVEYDLSRILENNKVLIEGAYYDESIELPFEFEDIKVIDLQANVREVSEVLLLRAVYLGESKFSYEVSIECKAELHFFCNEDDYEKLPYIYRKALEEDTEYPNRKNNEVHVSGVMETELRGSYTLSQIDENLEPSELKVHLSYIDSNKCEIESLLEMKKLVIKDLY
jgi:rRNA-processing protein FCF1